VIAVPGWVAATGGTASAAVVFTDNFEDGNSTGWTTTGGTWTVANDGTQVLQTSGTTAADSKAFTGSTWTDYTLQARIKPVSFDGANRFVGVAARVQDDLNYYYLALRSNNTVELKKLVAGTPTTLGSIPFTVTPGTWYTVRLQVTGTTITGSINGTQIASTTDPQHAIGRIGAITYSASASYDDVTVDATTSTPPPGRPSQCTGSSPITCHFAVAPGNYTVTAWIGDATSAGNTSMSVEARRRILPVVSTAAGAITRYVFTINVREPEGQPTGQGGTGTPGLDVTFGGTAPRLSGLTVAAAASPLVVYLAGDSTVCDQPTAPYTGWGQILPTHVGAGAVVANYGDSGESSGSFLNAAALFPTMRPLIKPNDLVFIQFGHNDKTTTAADFRGNLSSMISQVRARGGVPVLVTPPVRRLFSGSQLTDTALHINGVGVNLPAEMRGIGASLGLPLIDLTAKSEALVESLGPTNSARLYLTAATDGVTDNTHFSEYGAGQMADLVLQGVRERNLSLVPYLR
jgi:lysophospholipase L1-like esterase